MVSSFHYSEKFKLESGRYLPGFSLTYSTYGTLNEEKSNVVWICHALTGNAEPYDWWHSLVGENKLFNPQKHFIICANILGSAYGSTGPLSVNPETGIPYFHDFPELTVRDIVRSQMELRKFLQLEKIHVLLGGSLGGQQSLEWAIEEPESIENLILIATNAIHSPWGIAFNESQRLAIKADRTWYNYDSEAGLKGLKAARAVALLSYRNYNTYQATQSPEREGEKPAISYQNYQGDKLVTRFNAFSYWQLSKVMDSHDVGRERGGAAIALKKVKAKTLAIFISSDILFPGNESKYIAEHIPGAAYEEIDSIYGHDGFLIEGEKISAKILAHFSNLKTTTNQYEQVF